MATRPDTGGVRAAAELLERAIAAVQSIAFEEDPIDPLAAGVAAIGRIYADATPRRRRPRKRH